TNSTFTANRAIAGSGGSGGTSAIFVDEALGGAIAGGESATLAVSGCTFSHNEAVGGSNAAGGSMAKGRVGTAGGGGLAITNRAVATITSCAFDHDEALGGSNNTAGSAPVVVGAGRGGAIAALAFGGPSTLRASYLTLTDNVAAGGSGNTGGLLTNDG